MDEEHPASRLESSIRTLRQRATLASIALGAVVLARGVELAVLAYSISLLEEVPPDGASDELLARIHNADALLNANRIFIPVTFVVCALLFLRWTHRLVLVGRQLGASRRWKPAEAVWAWIIPFVSLVRPYQVANELHTALAPDRVIPPMPRANPEASHDYRSVAFIQPSPALKMPTALVGVWWGMFLVMTVGSRIVTGTSTREPHGIVGVISNYQSHIFVNAFGVLAAALAITVVRGITARAAERYRRICETTPEALAAQGIELELP